MGNNDWLRIIIISTNCPYKMTTNFENRFIFGAYIALSEKSLGKVPEGHQKMVKNCIEDYMNEYPLVWSNFTNDSQLLSIYLGIKYDFDKNIAIDNVKAFNRVLFNKRSIIDYNWLKNNVLQDINVFDETDDIIVRTINCLKLSLILTFLRKNLITNQMNTHFVAIPIKRFALEKKSSKKEG